MGWKLDEVTDYNGREKWYRGSSVDDQYALVAHGASLREEDQYETVTREEPLRIGAMAGVSRAYLAAAAPDLLRAAKIASRVLRDQYPNLDWAHDVGETLIVLEMAIKLATDTDFGDVSQKDRIQRAYDKHVRVPGKVNPCFLEHGFDQ